MSVASPESRLRREHTRRRGACVLLVAARALGGAYFMALEAAGFVYVAMADLVPGLHRCASLKQCATQLIFSVGGMGTMGLFHLGNCADLVAS